MTSLEMLETELMVDMTAIRNDKSIGHEIKLVNNNKYAVLEKYLKLVQGELGREPAPRPTAYEILLEVRPGYPHTGETRKVTSWCGNPITLENIEPVIYHYLRVEKYNVILRRI